jgi:hypothetical protein
MIVKTSTYKVERALRGSGRRSISSASGKNSMAVASAFFSLDGEFA